ncbi:MAG TPA: GDP-mannose 4,6-dehydratase, partial [Methanomassiliicoccaceae archaeon]|nr:GDP-mannose 4,6-dehydratase [Methanomassiliicoccaceae archaeon]
MIITGAAGFIGSNLTEHLLQEGHEVVGIDNLDDYYSGKTMFLERSIEDSNFSMVRGDILDLELMKKTMKGADAVVHLAAQAGVRFSVRDPLKSHMVNVVGTLNVLIAAAEGGVKRVVNSSSSSVYGNIDQRPVTETDEPRPVSPYATSKLAAEIYCRQFHELYGLDTVSLRYFTVYGPRQRPDMAIRIFTERILNGLPPQIFGDGEQTRDFTYIDDVVAAIRSAMIAPDLKGAALNISGGRPITINRLVQELKEVCGRRELEPIYLPPQAGDVNHTWGDPSLAMKLLGWKPRIGIKEGLRRYVEWYRTSEERRTYLGA